MKVISTSGTLLYATAILLNVGVVNGSFLRGSGQSEGDHLHRVLTDSTALYEGQSVTCYDREDCVFRWTGGELRGYPTVEIADSWNIRWRDDLAHVDCVHLPIGENMPLKNNEFVEDGSIVTCFGNEVKVYVVENRHLRWFPNPDVAESWEEKWRPEILVINCDVYRFGPDMPMKEE